MAAAVAHWRADWQGEAAFTTVLGARQKLSQEQAKNAELSESLSSERAEYARKLAAAAEKQTAALERLRTELTGSVEEQAAARAESERLKRIEQMAKKAAARISNQGLMRGWSGWQEQWLNHCRQKRMLAAAGARLARPALSAAVAHWRSDWESERREAIAAARQGTAAQLRDAVKTRDALQQEVQELQEDKARQVAAAKATLEKALEQLLQQGVTPVEVKSSEHVGSALQSQPPDAHMVIMHGGNQLGQHRVRLGDLVALFRRARLIIYIYIMYIYIDI